MRSALASSSAPSSVKGVGQITKTPDAVSSSRRMRAFLLASAEAAA